MQNLLNTETLRTTSQESYLCHPEIYRELALNQRKKIRYQSLGFSYS